MLGKMELKVQPAIMTDNFKIYYRTAESRVTGAPEQLHGRLAGALELLQPWPDKCMPATAAAPRQCLSSPRTNRWHSSW